MSDPVKPTDPDNHAASPAVRYVEVDETRAGQRLDNFLLAILKGVPKSRIYRCLRKGEVRVNKGRVGPEYRLQRGDRVRIPPIRVSVESVESAAAARGGNFEWLAGRVLFEDDHLLILDKPAGMAVHAGSGVATGIIEALRAWRPQAPMLELVHRLDRETSGCLLIAKTRAALTHLHAQLREGRTAKFYLALVRGRFRHSKTVNASLERHERGGERMVVVSDAITLIPSAASGRGRQPERAARDVVHSGKEAITRFHPRRQFGIATLVEIELLTGRTHQARVHAAHTGHPIAGDDKYGDREFNRLMRGHGLRRLFLHAARIEFTHPVRNKIMDAEAPVPDELSAVLDKLTTE
jgi:23S rRNA pseudouridine955/2504/2580 synthase